MIELNAKRWSLLTFEDIEALLQSDVAESYFLEFKSDGEPVRKFIKEVCAFANSYGGYIILGVKDNKEIEGCTTWNEIKVHTSIRDSISPMPWYDVRELQKDSRTIVVVRVEEGVNPPYVTNDGKMLIRSSSGSSPVKSTADLQLLYQKRKDHLAAVDKKISLPEIIKPPSNYCGYIDYGFSIITRESFDFYNDFYNIDVSDATKSLKTSRNSYSVSLLADSYLITVGKATSSDGLTVMKDVPPCSIYMIEIMRDGSARVRIPLIASADRINEICIVDPMAINELFREIYIGFVGSHLADNLIVAQRYEKLVVIRQFTPFFDQTRYPGLKTGLALAKRSSEHSIKYGGNVINVGHRIPTVGYDVIDERSLVDSGIEYNNYNLIKCLFNVKFLNFGYIDRLESEI